MTLIDKITNRHLLIIGGGILALICGIVIYSILSIKSITGILTNCARSDQDRIICLKTSSGTYLIKIKEQFGGSVLSSTFETWFNTFNSQTITLKGRVYKTGQTEQLVIDGKQIIDEVSK